MSLKKYKTTGTTGNAQDKAATKTKKKLSVMQHITAFIRKVFKLLQHLIHIAGELIQNAMHLTVFLFGYTVKIFSHPTTPCIVAILFFGAVTGIAAAQWFQIGVWLGSLFKLSSLWGFSAGVVGSLVGLGINVYQLAPQLWKIRKDVAQGYADLSINPNYESESDEQDVKERLGEWGSFGHKYLKRARISSYAIEAALVLGWCFSSGLDFFKIIQAAVSLLLPEKCLGWVSSTYSVLGRVSEHINSDEAPKVDNVQF